jgi:phosphatidate phosphatase APP1
MFNKRSSIERLRASARAQTRSRWHAVRDDVVMHFAYGQGARAILEGRVIDFEAERVASPGDAALTNLRQTLRLLFNKERMHKAVRVWMTAHEWQGATDAEGFFRFEPHNLAALPPGWHRIHAEAGDAQDEIGLLLVPPENVYGVISDVDDTLLISQVTRKWQLLINTLLRNPLQRLVVPGIAHLYRSLLERNPQPHCAPMFYLSATPRQLHLPLQAILDHNDLPKGVLVTKRVTNDRSSESLNQFVYKFAKIEEILELVPHARFVLIGDDGEHDPEVFESVREYYPDRIEAIWIRRVHPDPARPRIAHQGDLADLLREHAKAHARGLRIADQINPT